MCFLARYCWYTASFIIITCLLGSMLVELLRDIILGDDGVWVGVCVGDLLPVLDMLAVLDLMPLLQRGSRELSLLSIHLSMECTASVEGRR